MHELHLRLWPERDLFSFFTSGFKFYCACLSFPRCLTCLLDLQDVQWIRKLVVVCVSWPGYSSYLKKKKKEDEWDNNKDTCRSCS